jgi:hypothetical protein
VPEKNAILNQSEYKALQQGSLETCFSVLKCIGKCTKHYSSTIPGPNPFDSPKKEPAKE